MLFVFFCVFLSTFALIKQGEFHRVHSPKENVPEALLGLAEPWSGNPLGVTAESQPSPCFPVDSLTLLWLTSELWAVLSWLTLGRGSAHSAPAQGSRWRTRDRDVGISLGAVFVHGWHHSITEGVG